MGREETKFCERYESEDYFKKRVKGCSATENGEFTDINIDFFSLGNEKFPSMLGSINLMCRGVFCYASSDIPLKRQDAENTERLKRELKDRGLEIVNIHNHPDSVHFHFVTRGEKASVYARINSLIDNIIY